MKPKRNGALREAWIICFILGLIMLNYPFIHIFNKTTQLLGIPLLVLYLLLGWPLSILVIHLFSKYLDRKRGGDGEPPR